MLIRYKDLTSLTIDTDDGADHKVADVLVTDRDLELAYVVAAFDGWFASNKAVVRRQDFGAPDMSAGVWPTRIRQDDLKHAPPPRDDQAGARGPDRNATTTLLLGPYGGVIGPGIAREDDASPAVPGQTDPAGLAGDGAPRSVGDWLGAPVAASDRAAGDLMDVLFDSDDWRVSMLVVATGSGGPEHQRVVPARLIERIDWDAPGVQLNCAAERVDSSPDLYDMRDAFEGKWYNQVLAYYGFQS